MFIKVQKVSPTSLASWRTLLIPQHLAHLWSASILVPATYCGDNVQFSQRPRYWGDCAWSLWGKAEIVLEGKWGRVCWFSAECEDVISMAEIDVRQDFEATLIFRAHSSHSAAGCLCFPGPKFAVLPLPCLAFPEHKLQHEEVPWAGLCCRAASLPPSGSECQFLWFSPEAQPGSRALAMRSSAANTANPTFAGCFGAGSTALPSSGARASLSPAGKWLFTNVLDHLWQKQQQKGLQNTLRSWQCIGHILPAVTFYCRKSCLRPFLHHFGCLLLGDQHSHLPICQRGPLEGIQLQQAAVSRGRGSKGMELTCSSPAGSHVDQRGHPWSEPDFCDFLER